MQRDLRPLADTTFDVVIVGAGIYGAIAAADAARRGLSVALVERGDFGSGTSFNSVKTLHGGLRSLQAMNLRQMRLFIRERRALARVAPHLLRILPCVVPTYRDVRRGAALMQVALAINDLVARDCNDGIEDPRLLVPPSRLVSRDECLAMSPAVDPDGVTGGALWHDYQMTSADRMTLAFIRSAAKAGARAANYAPVTKLLVQGAHVEGVSIQDRFSDASVDVRARIVLNAAGPWAASLVSTLPGGPAATPAAALSRAMNLVTRSFLGTHACGGLAGGRFLFAVPWQGASIVGTSHDPHDGGPNLMINRAHIEALLGDARQAFPAAGLTFDDIRLVHRGLLPMISAANGHVQLLRESAIVDHRRSGLSGLVSMFGVRYTTARQTAADAVDAVFTSLGYSQAPPCRTDRDPVDGGEMSAADDLVRDMSAARPGASETEIRRLVSTYGTRATDMLALSEPPALSVPLSGSCPVLAGEILYAARAEAAVHLADAIVRRTGAGAAGHPGPEAVARAAAVMADELGWSEERRQREIAEVDAFYELPR